VSNLGRLLRGQQNCLAEAVLRLDGCLGLGHGWDWGGGRLDQGLLQLLELYGLRQSVDRLATLPIVVKSLLNISPEGDDTTDPWHLQDQVGIMWDHHEFGECWSSQESGVHSLEIGDLKLNSLRAKIFLSLLDYKKSDLTDRGFCCTRDYAMEKSLTGAQHRPR
jgi:hypothetical protein